MHKKIVALIFIAAMLISSPTFVFAFGLGEIEINSALNQPMDAEIELIGFKADQIDEVYVELADQQMFERVGVPRPYILTRLKFTPMISKGKPIIRITSTDAIREPFLTFLIDVRWAKGKLLREFTVLLDPPVFGDKAKATIQAPKVSTQALAAKKSVPKSSNIATTPAPRVPTPSVRPKQATVPSTVSKPVTLKKTKSPSGGSRTVKRGDTLWSIAEPYARENGVSVNQMMLAIQSANPEGFSANNINNLKSGVVLRIPTENLANYSAKEALAEVQRQWQVWKQGSQASSVAVNVDAGEMQTDDAVAVTDQKDPDSTKSSKLSILGEGDSTDGKSGDDANATLNELRNQVSLLKESAQSKGQENSELKDRIQSLESMIKKQEDIISLQNEQLAQLQNSLTTSGTEDEAVSEQLAVEEIEAVVEEAMQEASPEVVEEVGAAEESAIKPATVEPLPDFSDPIPEEFLLAEQDQVPAESLNEQAEIVEEAITESDEAAVVQEPTTTETSQVSMIDNIMGMLQEQSRNLLYAGGGLLILLLGWLGIKRRNADEEATEVTASGLPAFAEEPSVDENLDDTVVASSDSVDEALDELEVVDANLDEMLDGDSSETAMFDSSMLDLDNPDEVKEFTGDENLGEDTESLEQVQENLTAELETLSFDSDDIDPESMEEDSLPTLQTSEIGKPDIDMDELDEDLAARETGTFEKDMLSDNVTELFDAGDVGDIDSAMTDLGEFGDDYDLETPSVIEEVGTKLDLARAFVDMGDEDAAKETLTEVMEQGDQTQIQEAKDLLDKLS